MANDTLADKLSRLSVNSRPEMPLSFWSLPLELRRIIYQYVAQDNRVHVAVPASQISRVYDQVTLIPGLPVIMQASRQLREEYAPYHGHGHLVRCTDYSDFQAWSQGIGQCLLDNLLEVELVLGMSVSVVKDRGLDVPPPNAPSYLKQITLRIRMFGRMGQVPVTADHIWARFWYDVDNEDCRDDALKTIRPGEIERVTTEIIRRLPPNDEPITMRNLVKIVAWLGVNGHVDFEEIERRGCDWYYKKETRVNTLVVREGNGTRQVIKMWLPADLNTGHVTRTTIWTEYNI